MPVLIRYAIIIVNDQLDAAGLQASQKFMYVPVRINLRIQKMQKHVSINCYTI